MFYCFFLYPTTKLNSQFLRSNMCSSIYVVGLRSELLVRLPCYLLNLHILFVQSPGESNLRQSDFLSRNECNQPLFQWFLVEKVIFLNLIPFITLCLSLPAITHMLHEIINLVECNSSIC